MRLRWSTLALGLVCGFAAQGLVCGFAAQAADVPQTGDLKRSYVFAGTGKTVPYRLVVPKSYDPAKSYPLIVVLHGGGGDENSALDHSNLAAMADQRGYIVLAPFGNGPFGGFGNIYPVVVNHGTAAGSAGFREASITGIRPPPPAGPPDMKPAPVDDYVEQLPGELMDPVAGRLSEQETFAAIDEVKRAYTIDTRRIYLMGNSMGGVATLYLAAHRPEVWAAISPSDGPIAAWSYPYTRLKDANLPVLFIHGALDEKSNPHWTELLASDAKQAGVDAQMLVVQDGTHSSGWTHVLPAIFDFFDHHRQTASH